MPTDNMINPFDPIWYKEAFDKHISTGDFINRQNQLILDGYQIPDSDGSRSSIFRNDAILNNSFSELDVRESLRDIYNNTTHKLIASNHDDVNFFQWNGYMNDLKYSQNTNICEYRIPWNRFITPGERDKFKLSQFYRKWIKVENILSAIDLVI